MMKRIAISALVLFGGIACAFAQGQPGPGQVMGNSSAAGRPARAESVTAILDRALGSTRGAIIERGASGWAIVGPHATVGMPWVSAGTGADPGYGVAVVAGGGTGLAVGTSGGVPFYNSATTMQSSAALAVSRIVFGGGAGAAPATGLALGTTTQVLHGNAAGLPTWAAVSLTADVSGQLPIANGGCNGTTAATCLNNITPTPVRAGDFIYWSGSAWVSLGGNNSGTKFLQEDASGVPSWVVAPGSGTVTSAQISAGIGIAVATTSGANPCVTTCNLTVSLTAARQTLPTVQSFTTGTNATYTTPANVLWIEIWVIGGGAGGAGGNNGSNSTAGNPSCWKTSGTACTTPDYQAGGGGVANNTTPGAGGTVSGANTCNLLSAAGNAGGVSVPSTASLGGLGGSGGGSGILGGGGTGAAGAVNGNAATANTGGGGGGGGQSTATPAYPGTGGGGGAACAAIINSPAATYVYTVGATASGAANGTNGGTGGTGAAGKIWVIEHYGS